MLENDEQFESESAGAEASVHLPWDIIEPPEPVEPVAAEAVAETAADLAEAAADVAPVDEPADEGDGAAEPATPGIDSQVSNLKSEISDLAFEISDVEQDLSAAKPADSAEASDEPTGAASAEPIIPARRIALPVLSSGPASSPRTIALPVVAATTPASDMPVEACEDDQLTAIPTEAPSLTLPRNTGGGNDGQTDASPSADPAALDAPPRHIALPVIMADAVEPQDQPLPWSVAASADITDGPADAPSDPQPPALAYAPAFLAVDDEGLPIPDEIADQLDVEIPSLPPETLEPEGIATAAAEQVTPSGSGLWTIPLMCIGIAILACCLLIPQADKNRRLAWEREGLRRNLEQLQKQVEINDNFLEALTSDRFLAKRLAQRQLNVVPAGTTVLELDGIHGMNASPFQLVTVPPPPSLPEYQPIGGRFAEMCRNPQTQLYLIGGGLFAIAAGLVLGRDRPQSA